MGQKSFTKEVKLHGKEVDINIVYDPKEVLEFTDVLRQALYRAQSADVLPGTEKAGAEVIVHFCSDLIEQSLKDDPSLIPTDPFSVNMKIGDLPSRISLAYDHRISSPPCAFILGNIAFFDNTFRILAEKSGGDTKLLNSEALKHLKAVIKHELRHHSEARLFKYDDAALERFRENNMSHIVAVVKAAAEVRIEAVAVFESDLLIGKDMILPWDNSHIREFMKAFRKADLEKLVEYVHLKFHHTVAIVMSYIVALDHLKSKAELVESREWLNRSAKRLDSELKEADQIRLAPFPRKLIRKAAMHMTKMNTEEFLREYERACKRLGISRRNRLITWKAYKKAVHKAYKKELKMIEKSGFFPKLVVKALKKFFFG
jgi:hypothetical protein